jgi:hypothetical protein
MVARGEIGFLISSIAESDGIYKGTENTGSESASDIFLIVSWAIVLCTVLGPICVGVFVRKIRHERASQGLEGRNEDITCGIWAVSTSKFGKSSGKVR